LRHLTLLVLAAGLFLTPAFAQDPAPEAPTTEEAAPEEATPDAETPPAAEEAEEAASPETEEVEEVAEDATELVEDVIAAAESGQWPIAIGLILIAVVAVLRKVGIEDKLPKGSKSLPWVTLGLAAAASIGAALLGQMEWSAVITTTATSAGVAMGGWDLSKLFKKAQEKAEEKRGIEWSTK